MSANSEVIIFLYLLSVFCQLKILICFYFLLTTGVGLTVVQFLGGCILRKPLS